MTSDKICVISDSPLQLVYFRCGNAQGPSTLTVLPSVDDICQTVPMFDSGDMSKQQDNSTFTEDLKSGVKFSQKLNLTQLPDDNKVANSLITDADVGRYRSTMNRRLYPALCEIGAASCEVGPQLYGVLCGLCGNANRSSTDGIIASNGTDETQTKDFTLQWVVNSDADSCIEECVGGVSCPLFTQNQTKSFPRIKGNSLGIECTLLQRNNGPFADCHSYIDPEPFFRSCVDNVFVNTSDSSMCKILTAYANICQRLSARVQIWRNISKCPMECPMNGHYEICGSACPATCGNPEAHSSFTWPCVESCQCNKGYLLSGGECLPHSKCGCLHQGSYNLPKENFWIDNHCLKKCVCQPSSKRVMCAQSHCQDGKVCKVLNGVLGCHVDGPGLCIVKGDPHYTTFDGLNFDVYGNCTYLLNSHCLTRGALEHFRVEVQN